MHVSPYMEEHTLLEWYYQSKRYCPVMVALEGSALWGKTLATALLHDRNWTITFGLIVPCRMSSAKEE